MAEITIPDRLLVAIGGNATHPKDIEGTSEEQEAIAHSRKPTENVEAYQLYLRGRYFWQRRGEDNIRRAIGLFQQATKLDPQFARAWSSLAAAHITLPVYSDAPGDEQSLLAESAAQTALELDDSLAEAYAVLGDITRVDRKWAEAKAYYLRAIASEPKNSTAHLWYTEHQASVGHMHDAFEEALIAYSLDPLHPATNAHLATLYLWLGDTTNALKYAMTAWDLGYGVGLDIQVRTHLSLGNFERAIEVAEQLDNHLDFPVGFAKLFVEAKMDEAKKTLFLETLAEYETTMGLNVLLTSYAGLGRIDDAYRVVSMGRDSAGPNIWWRLWREGMEAFRQDPRFTELVTELGLVDYWREHGWPDACQPVGDRLICE